MASNKDTVQQYLDRLKKDVTEADQELVNALAQEAFKKSALEKKTRWADVLKDLLATITETNRLGMIYLGTLERTRKYNEKSGKNARLCIDAIKILICEGKKLLDCTEVLKGQIKVLTDRIDNKIPDKGANSIMANLAALKTATDDALTAIKDAIKALLVTYHEEEDLWGLLAGEKGLLFQVVGSYKLMTDGKKPDLEDCASCHPQKTPLFPMDDETCDFYTKTKRQYEETLDELKDLQKEVEVVSCKREFAQARKTALDKAYAAALAAKSCETAPAAAARR
ncbi:hypothetical protein L3C95_18915 [Chitinophaga filiformis]|uniref:hypothetical protein n=1 Tax=Chitinophaga filiformis TaxID=104663 RepID=UPI001F354B04|nr:hypothetical protein [Chitinophaga filiformis]MCF6404980.1 hypothetical protein [Chitinophaga filiformis]